MCIHREHGCRIRHCCNRGRVAATLEGNATAFQTTATLPLCQGTALHRDWKDSAVQVAQTTTRGKRKWHLRVVATSILSLCLISFPVAWDSLNSFATTGFTRLGNGKHEYLVRAFNDLPKL